MKRPLLWKVLGGSLGGALVGAAASFYWPAWEAGLVGWGCANALVVAWA